MNVFCVMFCVLFRRLRFSSDADNVRLTNACIIIIILYDWITAQFVSGSAAESNGSLLLALWLQSPIGWLPRTGISSATLRSFKVWDYLYLWVAMQTRWGICELLKRQSWHVSYYK